MVIDLRKYAKNDFWNKIAIISINKSEEGGFRFLRLLRWSKIVLGDQYNLFGINFADKVYGDQINLIGCNFVKEGYNDQFNFLGLNKSKFVHGSQSNGLGINIAKKVKDKQFNFLGLNKSKLVSESQSNGFGINIAEKVFGYQAGDFINLLNIETKNKKPKQRRCIIRYNPLEKIGLGSSVWSKIEKVDIYFEKIKKRIFDNNRRTTDNNKYQKILESFILKKPTLRKKITGHWTYDDILSRQAKKRLNEFEDVTEPIKSFAKEKVISHTIT